MSALTYLLQTAEQEEMDCVCVNDRCTLIGSFCHQCTSAATHTHTHMNNV